MSKLKHKDIQEFAFIIPAVVLYLIFVIYPLFKGFYYSLTDWSGVTAKYNFVGFKNYYNMFHDKYVLQPLLNTFIYAFATTVILNVLGLILAVFVENLGRTKNFFRGFLYLPSVLSPIVVGFIFNFLFANSLETIGDSIGWQAMANNLLGDKRYALAMCVLVACWKSAGWYMVIYIAGLQGIDQSLYDSAMIDGATEWTKFKYVTFPLLAPAFTINMVLAVERAFKEYDLIFALTGGGPGRASEVVSLTIYNESFTNKRAGYGSALGIVLFIIVVAITLFEMKFLRKREDNARL